MSCSIPTMETDSKGNTVSCLWALLEPLRLRDWFRSWLSCLPLADLSLLERNSVAGDVSSMGVAGFGVLGALPRKMWISFQTFVRCPKDEMPNSRRSSNLRVVKIAPEISFSSNFSTIDHSKPASCIHLATCRGVHWVMSFRSESAIFSVNRDSFWRLVGLLGDTGVGGLIVCTGKGTDGCEVIGDISRTYWCGISRDEETELRNKCGPRGPSTGFFGPKSKLKDWNSFVAEAGVNTSSYDDNVVSLALPAWMVTC